MANAVAMRAAFGRLGFTAAASLLITDDQDINELSELAIFTDPEIESLCKVLRSPGGTVANDVAAIDNGGPLVVRDPGLKVSVRAENNLKEACYYLRHRIRVARPVTPVDITLANVRTIKDLRLAEKEHKDPEHEPTINVKDWTKTMEAIEEYLGKHLGATGIPLAYVVRRDRVDENVIIDPAGEYSGAKQEMINRAPHVDALVSLYLPT